MNKNSIRTGSLTLLLLITTVALAALGLLSYQTAHANLSRTLTAPRPTTKTMQPARNLWQRSTPHF